MAKIIDGFYARSESEREYKRGWEAALELHRSRWAVAVGLRKQDEATKLYAVLVEAVKEYNAIFYPDWADCAKPVVDEGEEVQRAA